MKGAILCYGPLTLRARTEEQTVETICGKPYREGEYGVTKDWTLVNCPICIQDRPRAYVPKPWTMPEVDEEPRKRGRPSVARTPAYSRG